MGREAGLERRQQQQLKRCEKLFPFLLHDPSPRNSRPSSRPALLLLHPPSCRPALLPIHVPRPRPPRPSLLHLSRLLFRDLSTSVREGDCARRGMQSKCRRCRRPLPNANLPFPPPLPLLPLLREQNRSRTVGVGERMMGIW